MDVLLGGWLDDVCLPVWDAWMDGCMCAWAD
jgi:hypothetical protein